MTEENRNGDLWEAGAQTDGAEEANDAEAAFAAEEQPAAEVCRFRYTEQQITEIKRIERAYPLRRLVVALLFFAVAVVLRGWGESSFFAAGFFLALGLERLNELLRWQKYWKTGLPIIRKNIYEYRICDGYFVGRIYRDGLCVRMQRVLFADVEQLVETKDYLLLVYSGGIMAIPKAELGFRSGFYTVKAVVDAQKPKALTGWRKGLAIVMCIASVLVPFVGLTLMPGLLNLNQYLCVYGLMALIPAVTVLYALLLRRKGYQTRRTMLVGLSMLMGMLFGILAVFFL